MENPCKIICFGDSITKGYIPYFEKYFRKYFPEIKLGIINARHTYTVKRLNYLPSIFRDYTEINTKRRL